MSVARGLICMAGAALGLTMAYDRYTSKEADRQTEYENIAHHAQEADMLHHATAYTGNNMFTKLALHFQSHRWFLGLRQNLAYYGMGFKDGIVDNALPLGLAAVSLSVGFPRQVGGFLSGAWHLLAGAGGVLGSVFGGIGRYIGGMRIGGGFLGSIATGIRSMGPAGAVIAALTAAIGYCAYTRFRGEFNHQNQREYFNPFLPPGDH